MTLFIKNMVCDRCVLVVKTELELSGFTPISIQLGEAQIKEEPTTPQLEQLSQKLNLLGFELIENPKQRIIEKIKNLIIESVHYSDRDLNINLSSYLETQLHKDYNYLSNLFSDAENSTIEKFFINQKIERVKELLTYGELSLSEIADQMGYSHISYLSAQFKKITGQTPSQFKQLNKSTRKSLDKI